MPNPKSETRAAGPKREIARTAAEATPFVRLFLAILCAGILVTPCPAATRDWTGDASGSWSDPNNWDPAGVPQDGDTLRFRAFANRTMLNDLVGLRIASLVFGHYDYVLSGNTLTLGVFPTDLLIWTPMTDGSGSATINCPLVLGTNGCAFSCVPGKEGSSATLRINADLNLNGFSLRLVSFPGGENSDAKIEMAGSISGNGDVKIVPSHPDRGTIEFIGTAENTFSGTLRVTSGGALPDAGVYFNKQAGSVVTNRLELLAGVTVDVERPHQIGDNAIVCLTEGSQLLFHGNTETIGSLCLTNSLGDTEPSLVDTGGATLSVLGDIVALNNATNANVRPTIRGILGLPGGTEAIRAAAMSLKDAAAIVASAPLPASNSLALQPFYSPVK